MTFYRDSVLPLLVGYGYWLVYRSSKTCLRRTRGLRAPAGEPTRQGGAHHRNLLILAALGLDLLAPILLT
jgi:hypothetical protein